MWGRKVNTMFTKTFVATENVNWLLAGLLGTDAAERMIRDFLRTAQLALVGSLLCTGASLKEDAILEMVQERVETLDAARKLDGIFDVMAALRGFGSWLRFFGEEVGGDIADAFADALAAFEDAEATFAGATGCDYPVLFATKK